MTTTSTIRPRIGQIVEFVTTYPGAEGRTIRGRVSHVGSTAYPCNPSVDTMIGSHELNAKEWGSSVRVIREGASYAEFAASERNA